MLCVIFASITRCASDTGVVTESQGNYFIAKQGATGFNAVAPIKVEAVEAARRFCLGQPGPRNDMFVTRTSEIPPGPFRQFPKVEGVYRADHPVDDDRERLLGISRLAGARHGRAALALRAETATDRYVKRERELKRCCSSTN